MNQIEGYYEDYYKHYQKLFDNIEKAYNLGIAKDEIDDFVFEGYQKNEKDTEVKHNEELTVLLNLSSMIHVRLSLY